MNLLQLDDDLLWSDHDQTIDDAEERMFIVDLRHESQNIDFAV